MNKFQVRIHTTGKVGRQCIRRLAKLAGVSAPLSTTLRQAYRYLDNAHVDYNLHKPNARQYRDQEQQQRLREAEETGDTTEHKRQIGRAHV